MVGLCGAICSRTSGAATKLASHITELLRSSLTLVVVALQQYDKFYAGFVKKSKPKPGVIVPGAQQLDTKQPAEKGAKQPEPST